MADGEDTCVHCGVRIVAVTFPSTLTSGQVVWVHVPTEGPVYMLIQCSLVATPASPSSVPTEER